MNTVDPKNYSPKSSCLKDKVILITGASDGIGKQAAITFASYGSETILIGKDLGKLEKTYNEIKELGYLEPTIHAMDHTTSSENDYIEVISAIESEFGKLDGLLCNAGILGSKKSLSQYDYKTWKKVLKVNLDATFLLTKNALPLLKKQKNASIVLTTSGVGRKGRAFWGAYSVSKFGVESLTQILHEELERISKVRVNSINPGAIRTDMRKEAYPAEDPNELLSPLDIMNAYLYLMSDDSIGFSGNSIDAQ